MFRYDIFVKQPPSMQVEDGMVQVDFYSGDTIVGCVMPIGTFARHLADAQKLYALWDATRQDVVVPIKRKRRRKDQAASP